MPMVKDAINKMTVEEKFSTMDYIWASLSADSDRLIPAWHERELKATEARVVAGVDEKRLGYFFRPEKRFHQAIYYKMSGTTVTVWRILDMRFDPRRIFAALRETSGE